MATIDKNGANTAALATLNAEKPDEKKMTIRQSKYPNNMIEQDHRNIKRHTQLIMGFKSFRLAHTLIAGIELLHMIQKWKFQHLQNERLSPAEQFNLLAT